MNTRDLIAFLLNLMVLTADFAQFSESHNLLFITSNYVNVLLYRILIGFQHII